MRALDGVKMLEIFDGACDIFDGAAVIAIALQEQHIHLALAGPLYIGAYGVIRILFGKMTIKHHGDPVYRQPLHGVQSPGFCIHIQCSFLC